MLDKKEGTGKFEHIESQIKITYSDSETSFEGVIDLEKEEITGTAKQIVGFLSGSEGTFQLKVEKNSTQYF